MNKQQLYAKFYDLEYQNKKDDVNFYYRLAQKIDGPILECACGTGRILVPIAQSGKEIWGFDINTDMLNIAKQKVETLTLSKKTRIFHDDLTKFASPFLKKREFKFIFLSFDGLAYLAQKNGAFYSVKETQQRQYSALKNIARHLDKHGLFAFDLFSPNDLSREHIVRHHFSQVVKCKTWNLFSSIQIPVQRIFQIHYFMEILEANGIHRRWHYPISGYQSSFEEISFLLKKAGLRPEKIYGNFNLEPYEKTSKQMIFVCRKV